MQVKLSVFLHVNQVRLISFFDAHDEKGQVENKLKVGAVTAINFVHVHPNWDTEISSNKSAR